MAKYSFDEMLDKVDHIVDGLGHPIDEQIKPLVIGLLMWGIRTTASCEGHAEEGRHFPWVEVVADGIPLLLELIGKQNRPVLLDGRPNDNQWVLKPGPEDSVHVIPQNSNRLIPEMQADAIEFGQFLQILSE